ncbi:MAG: hypothetical protein Q9167_006530 [Letrouitia subvulpina]
MTARLKPTAVGGPLWIEKENEQIAQFRTQEAEDFAFSVRNELEFLNEHMAEIFNKSQINITEVFKTPGKLRRGKTPRTANKYREPLTDIFAPNLRPNATPSHTPEQSKTQALFKVSKDPISPIVKKAIKSNTDSGYHGMTEDEMELEEQAAGANPSGTQAPLDIPTESQAKRNRLSREESTVDRSFHSAIEDFNQGAIDEASAEEVDAKTPTQTRCVSVAIGPQTDQEDRYSDHKNDLDEGDKDSLLAGRADRCGSRSPSEGSSPVNPVIRKSSLTFATLPAREPLTTKKSIGPSLSRNSNVDGSRATINRGSFLERITSGKSLGGFRQPDGIPDSTAGVETKVERPDKSEPLNEKSDVDGKSTRLHNKSSTQRLHERIDMLRKSQLGRPTKSIPSVPLSASEVLEPSVTVPEPLESARRPEDEEDWITALPKPQSHELKRPQLPKSVSADVMEDLKSTTNISAKDFEETIREENTSPRRPSLPQDIRSNLSQGLKSPARADGRQKGNPSQKVAEQQSAFAVNNGSSFNEVQPLNPDGTPASKRYVDGPLSASKSKLESIMKSARGLFNSSAGVSAQAKMEICSPAAAPLDNKIQLDKPSIADGKSGLYPNLQSTTNTKVHLAPTTMSPSKPAEGRTTRSSTEKRERKKEQEAKERQRAKGTFDTASASQGEQSRNIGLEESNELNKTLTEALAKEAKQQQQPTRRSPRRLQNQRNSDNSMEDSTVPTTTTTQQVPPASAQPNPQPSHTQRPKDARRPVRPVKDAVHKPEPQRVAIRVGTLSMSHRPPMNNAALSSNLQESLAPAQPRPPGLTRQASNTSLQSSTSQSNVKCTANTKPRALIAAEKKKEQDEKQAQRKQEQKREIEKKRAAQQEEARRQEQLQRQELERQRERDRVAAADDSKKTAQRQAIEKRRLELAKKDQQRTAPAAQHHPPNNTRPELGGSRPPSRLHTVQEHKHSVTHPLPNPARPPIKRVFEPEADELVQNSRLLGGHQYQQTDAKRRRTDDEDALDEQETNVRPTMDVPRSYVNGFPSMPPHSANNGYPITKPSTVAAQPGRPGQAPDMSKYAHGRIVFAEAPNPPYPAHHKTPLPSKQLTANQPSAKSSPQYVNGEHIHLEDIADSEDEDDDSEAEAKKQAKNAMLPSWVHSPALRVTLEDQEKNIDPDSVFGPPANVDMEAMFKDRHHKFRSRTSSANWNMGDRLTSEEMKEDKRARERILREGGWTYGL